LAAHVWRRIGSCHCNRHTATAALDAAQKSGGGGARLVDTTETLRAGLTRGIYRCVCMCVCNIQHMYIYIIIHDESLRRCVFILRVCAPSCSSADNMLTPEGYPPPQHSSRHGPQRTQHTASTAATPRYPQGRRQAPANAPAPFNLHMRMRVRGGPSATTLPSFLRV